MNFLIKEYSSKPLNFPLNFLRISCDLENLASAFTTPPELMVSMSKKNQGIDDRFYQRQCFFGISYEEKTEMMEILPNMICINTIKVMHYDIYVILALVAIVTSQRQNMQEGYSSSHALSPLRTTCQATSFMVLLWAY